MIVELRYAATTQKFYFFAADVSTRVHMVGEPTEREMVLRSIRAQGGRITVDRAGFIAGWVYPGPGVEARYVREGWVKELYPRFIRSYVMAAGSEFRMSGGVVACKR